MWSVKGNSLCTHVLCARRGSFSMHNYDDKIALLGHTVSTDGWCLKRANKAGEFFKYTICVFQMNINVSSEASWRYFRMKM